MHANDLELNIATRMKQNKVNAMLFFMLLWFIEFGAKTSTFVIALIQN
jgi:hypothetical protein